MIDSHCHLADEAFAADLGEVIARARDAGLVEALCVVDPSDPGDVARVASVINSWDAVRTTAGVHPHRSAQFADNPAGAMEAVEGRARDDGRLRAVGEVGLDYHYDFAPREVQRAVFEAQVLFARRAGLPLVVHTREADADTIEILERVGEGAVRGVFHCFSGNKALADRAVALGFHVSFSGILTFPKADTIRQAAAAVPLDRCLVETDCPYLAPRPFRGKRNEPAWVVHIAKALAAARGMDVAELAAALGRNYRTLFCP